MKKYLHIILLILITCGSRAQQKAVFILLDGIPADVIEQVPTPALDEIAGLGGYSRAYVGGEKGGYSETPTVSAPGYMNMITATWAHKHRVRDNAVKNPNYHYWNIFRVAKKGNPKLRTALFSTWEDNRTKLIGHGKPEAGGQLLDYWFDGFEHDTLQFPHRPDRKFIFEIDEHVSKEAARYISANGPDLSWVYLEFTDDIGHLFGDGKEMEDAVKKADNQVERIWEAIKTREKQTGEKWMIVITTDHGRNPGDGKSHGRQSERERLIWIVTNSDRLNPRFEHQPAIVDIMPSVLRHLDLEIPPGVKSEMDGIAFIDQVSVDKLRVQLQKNKLHIQWNAIIETGELEIYLATTNHFRSGGEDHYNKIATVAVSEQHCKVRIPEKSEFYKVLIKAPNNWVSRWVSRKQHSNSASGAKRATEVTPMGSKRKKELQ